jgi:hypothetical protein
MAAMTQIQNNPAINLLAFYPTGVGSSLTAQYIACDPTNGNFFSATGRDLVTFIAVPASAAAAWNAAATYTIGQVVNFGLSSIITALAITSNVATITSVNTWQAGDVVTLAGLTTTIDLNNTTAIVLGSTGSAFTATVSHANVVSGSETGNAFITATPFKATATSQNVHPTSTAGAADWATYVGGADTVSVTSAPDSCTGRTANIVNYLVPVFDSTKSNVEFLVLPSSTFTQASGQVQFQASSNLVFVYVRNL